MSDWNLISASFTDKLMLFFYYVVQEDTTDDNQAPDGYYVPRILFVGKYLLNKNYNLLKYIHVFLL